MARKTVSRKTTATRRSEFQPRQLLLAGLGAVSLGRKQAIKSYSQATGEIGNLRVRSETVMKEAEAAARSLRKQVEGKVLQFRKTTEKQLAPVLARFGVNAGVKAPVPAASKAKSASAPAKRRARR